MEDDHLICDTCRGQAFEAIVDYGSYCLRCTECRGIGVATSWIAVGPSITERISIFREGESLALLEGNGPDIWQDVSKLASDGTILIIKDQSGGESFV